MAFIFRYMCILSCLAHFSCGEDAIEPRFSVIQEKIFAGPAPAAKYDPWQIKEKPLE